MSEGHLLIKRKAGLMKSLVSLPGQNAQGAVHHKEEEEEETPVSPSWAAQFLRSCC